MMMIEIGGRDDDCDVYKNDFNDDLHVKRE